MIAGWVDVSARRSSADVERIEIAAGTEPTERRAAFPGGDIRIGGREADMGIERGVLIACIGSPRFRHGPAQRAAAEGRSIAAWAALLADKGERGLGLVAGRYAVAIVDLLKGSVLIACDRFATRSLCYAADRGRIAFADRADALPCESAPALDPQAIYDYLYFHVIPAPRTIFRGVSRLPAGSFVAFDGSGERVGRHWLPSFSERPKKSFEELGREFRTLVREAVAREANGQKIGAFLSGGTDSSTVSGMLSDVMGGPCATYSIGFEAAGYDEMEYARIASAHFKSDHHEYYLTPDDLVRSIPEVARHYDQPFGNSSALPAYYCARLAKADGIEKLLAGDGGDELFGGNTRYAKQRVFDVYHRLPAALRSNVIEPALLKAEWPAAIPLVRKAASYVRQAHLPMPERMNTYNLLEWLGVGEVLESAFVAQVDRGDPARQQRATYSGVDASLVNAMLAFDWKYTLADNDLPKVCGTASLAGIAVGFPFLADEIVDFSMQLPSSFKVRGLRLRYFFKESLRGFLPEAIITKKKHGFGLPFGPWLVRHDGLRALANDSLTALARRGVVRQSFIERLMSRGVNEQPGYFGEMVWILMMLENWLAHKAPRFGVGTS